ncbi:programmed cell death 6 protein-like [Trypanosoma cruzi cruzi]|uniref:Putative programmed cell death 6 protein-like n=1 Tax=Trypanosoma cruzi TaxID=5693 RepID=A0A2V2V632_TRYCR|nr:programmed cell death 6 protein-like [Trypanosoma cruzi cruzi]PWU90976.1 putative programmed cell death 6 protein-like [Trypanosoma cruzi]
MSYQPPYGYASSPQASPYFPGGNYYSTPPPIPQKQPFQTSPLFGTEQEAAQWFRAVSSSSGGYISVPQLQSALSQGGMNFSYATTERLISMFDANLDGAIDFTEFQGLNRYILSMRGGFSQRDTSRDGLLEENEVRMALSANFYQVDDTTFQTLMRKFDRRKRGSLGFDDYIELSLFVGKANDAFQAQSQGKAGATFSFSSFLSAGASLL